jgi:hypothetical protein
LARPSAIDIAKETHVALGTLVFVAVFAAIPLTIQGTLLLERRLLAVAPNGAFGIAISSFLCGGFLTVGVLYVLPIYISLAVLVAGFGLVVSVLGVAAHASARELDWLPNWRLVWKRGRWVLALTVFLVLLSTFAQPWSLKDKGRTSGHVPAAMVGSMTGLALARLRKKTANTDAV